MSDVQPIVIGNSVLFIEGSGKVIRDLTYDFEIDGYRGNSMVVFAEDLFDGYTVTDWAYQQDPYSIIWAIREDGKLLGFTYNREHNVFAWHLHETDGDFESIASISTDEGKDEVYVVVERTVDGSTVRYIELMKERLPYDSDFNRDITEAWFVDSGLAYDGTAATTISGLDHLEGELVSILADGNVVNQQTVSSGAIVLSIAAEKVKVGLPYTSYMETLDFVGALQGDTTQDKLKDVKSVVVSLEETRALWFGPSSDRLVEVAFRENEDYGDPTNLFNGDKEIFLEAGATRESRAYIRNTDPLPLTITALLPRLEYGES